MKQTFWNLPAYAKYDELLDDGSDDYLIKPVLVDDLTLVEQSNRNEYILYGPEEALLYRPVKLITRLGMELYCATVSLFKRRID